VLLYAGVAEVMAGSVRKHWQMNRPIEFEGSATAAWAEQASAPSAGRRCSELEAEPDALRCISRLNDLASLYNDPWDALCRSTHRCLTPKYAHTDLVSFRVSIKVIVRRNHHDCEALGAG